MMRVLRWGLWSVLALALICPLPIFAQQAQLGAGTAVTQTSATGQAATACSSATAAGAQATLTLVNPGSNLSYYITLLGVWGGASGVPTAATPTMATMTGVAGTSPSVLPLASIYPAAGATGSVSGGFVPMISPIKSLAGTTVTVVGPTAITNMTQWVVACYYIAP